MSPDLHRELRELLGAYALGQLDGSLKAHVEAHLGGCESCQAELRALAPVVASLRALGPDDIDQIDPPARSRRPVWRSVVASVLVAASWVIAFGIGSWYAGPRDEPPVIPVVLRLDQPGLTATAGLVRHTWGTELTLDATGLAVGRSYAVAFVRSDGTSVDAGSFLGTGSEPLHCRLMAALPIDDAFELQITDSTGALVMEAELR